MKKRWFLIGMLLIALQGIAQPDLEYAQQSLLFSDNPMKGTARFRALAGSMGALGGDISAAVENPAGLAVFLHSDLSLTTGLHAYRNRAGFYDQEGPPRVSDASHLDLNQFGFVYSFGISDEAGIDRLAFAVNYQRNADYRRQLSIDPPDWPISFSILDLKGQPRDRQFDGYQRTQRGSKEVFNFMGAISLQKQLYLGLSLNAHNIESGDVYAGYDFGIPMADGAHSQSTEVESAKHTRASGFSATLGVLYRTPFKLRLGLSYTSPQWYQVRDSFVDPVQGDPAHTDYHLRTYGKWVLSAAYVFGQSGFIDLDYYRKDYRGLRLGPSATFSYDNQVLARWLHNTSNVRLGIEKRLQNLSLRFGGRWEASPYRGESDYPAIGDLWGAAAGIGYRFSPALFLDFSYDYAYRKRDYIIFYGNQQPIIITDPVQLKSSESNLLLTLRYGF